MGGGQALLSHLIRTPVLLDQGPMFLPFLNLNYPLEALSPNTNTLVGWGSQHVNLGDTLQSITDMWICGMVSSSFSA